MQSQGRFQPIRFGLQLGILGLLVAIVLNYQTILDQYALATFHPTGEMVAIETRLQLTPAARGVFYRAQPQVDDKASFNRDCNTQPHELELGCYYRGRIYILRIDNQSLASEMDVVTAHELLHALWDRMHDGEHKTLATELEAVYAQANDDDLKQRMAGYAQSEPGEEANELHSILATERADLSADLDAHYARYFVDRAVVVAAHAKYQAVFSQRRAELEQELVQIRAEKGQLGALNQQMDAYKSSGRIDLYNALVPKQNRLVDDINQRIGVYRQGVDEYNALSKSLDSQEITDTESAAQ